MNGNTTPPVQAIDPKAEVVKRLVNEALAAAQVELGTAAYQGNEVAAINIGDWPEGTIVDGLEVIIPTAPKLDKPAGFAFLGFQRTWRVRFINHAAIPDILEAAANAVATLFPDCDDPQILEESPETPEQMVIGVNVDQRH